MKSLKKHWRVQHGWRLFRMLCLSVCCVTAGENRGQSSSQRSQTTLLSIQNSKLDCAKMDVSHTQRHYQAVIDEQVCFFSFFVNPFASTCCANILIGRSSPEAFCSHVLCNEMFALLLFVFKCELQQAENEKNKQNRSGSSTACSQSVCYTVSELHSVAPREVFGKPLLIVQGSRTFRQWPQLLRDLLHHPLTSLVSVWCRNAEMLLLLRTVLLSSATANKKQ